MVLGGLSLGPADTIQPYTLHLTAREGNLVGLHHSLEDLHRVIYVKMSLSQ